MTRLLGARVAFLAPFLFCSLPLQICAAEAQTDLASLLESQGEFALALQHLEDASTTPGNAAATTDADTAALRARLRLYVRLRNDAEARALLERHAQRFDPTTVGLIGAVLALRRDDPEAALAHLEGARFPGALDAFAHKLRAEAYYELERWPEARAAIAAAGSGVLPLEMRRRLRVIESYACLQLADYARLRQLAPQLGRDARNNDRTGLILTQLAEVALSEGRTEQARDWLFDLLEARPTPADSAFAILDREMSSGTWEATAEERLELARFEMRRGRHRSARIRLRALLDVEPAPERKHVAAAWVAMAETYQRQRQERSCLDTLERQAKHIRGTPSEPEMLRLQARSQRRLGNEDAAIELYLKLAKRFPDHPRADDALYEAGWRYEIRGDFRRAEEIYARFQRSFPGSKLCDDAALREGLCAFRDARWETALGHFRSFALRYPNSTLLPRAIYWRLWIQEARGDTTRAHALRERLERDFPISYFTILAARDDLRAVPPRIDAAPTTRKVDGLELARRAHDKYMRALADLRAAPGVNVSAAFEDASLLWRFCVDHGLATEALWETRRLEQRYARRAGPLLELLEGNYLRGAHERLVRLSYLVSLRLSHPSRAEALEIVRHPALFSVTLSEATRSNGVSHAVVLAVMRHESAFDPRIDSHAGARGLMQLMPEVGRRLARQVGNPRLHADDLYDPVLNMTLGCRLFSQELERAEGRVEQALAAYNAGSVPAERWQRRLHPQEPRELYLDVAEYVETRSYLERVLGSGEVYRRIYDLP